MKQSDSKKSEWVDVHNDALMVSLGIRHPSYVQRDPSVWTKTPYEKKMLKSLRRLHKGKMYFHSIPTRPIPVKAKIIVYLKSNKLFPNSTYSKECYLHEIDNVISRYFDDSKGKNECLVLKYSYNGKTYKYWERPFWY